MMNRKLRVGIIGCGFISKVHMQGYQKLDNVEQVAFCDLIPERAEKACASYGSADAEVYIDYKELLARDDIDMVDVLTENKQHCQLTCDALRAGKHVMVEKPMSITSAEADQMILSAKESGKKFTVGYQSRFNDDAQLLRNLTIEGQMGKIYYAEAETLRRRGVPTWGTFLSLDKQGGGPMIDIGTHILDLCLWTMNDYSSVKSVLARNYDQLIPLAGYNNGGHWDIDKFEVEDSSFGTVVLESGATLVIKASWAVNIEEENSKHGLMLCGTKAGATICDSKQTLKINCSRNDRLWTCLPSNLKDDNNKYDQEMAAWVQCIREDTNPMVLPEQAAQVVRIIEAVYESARSGKAINY